MDEPVSPIKPLGEVAEKAIPGAGALTGGLECPTCGDRFPSKEALDEHLPSHKVA
jgi:hypothetical protein